MPNDLYNRASRVVEEILRRYADGATQVEHQALELKRKFPVGDRREANEKLAKWVCGLANSCLDAPGYIVFGVDEATGDLFDPGADLDEGSDLPRIFGPPRGVRKVGRGGSSRVHSVGCARREPGGRALSRPQSWALARFEAPTGARARRPDTRP